MYNYKLRIRNSIIELHSFQVGHLIRRSARQLLHLTLISWYITNVVHIEYYNIQYNIDMFSIYSIYSLYSLYILYIRYTQYSIGNPFTEVA